MANSTRNMHRTGPLLDALHLDDESLAQIRERALSFFEAGRPEQCVTLCKMLVALGDTDPGIVLVIASSYVLLGDPWTARGYFELGLKLAEEDGDDELREAALVWGRGLLELEVEDGH